MMLCSEIIYVDDNSNDGTEDEVKKLSREGHPVRIIVRRNEVRFVLLPTYSPFQFCFCV